MIRDIERRHDVEANEIAKAIATGFFSAVESG